MGKIIIYDNNDSEGEKCEDVINDYIQSGFVEIVDFRGRECVQMPAYQNCYDKHNKEYDWIAFFDCDEKNADLSRLGRTIAVIPSGIDDIIPSCHKKMAGQILQTGGCIISEYEPKLEMANWHFVGRNRIIAGLSAATVVIEAPDGSGALITADFALGYNRDLMFHKVGFNEQAVYIYGLVKKDLEIKYAAGKVSKYKKI